MATALIRKRGDGGGDGDASNSNASPTPAKRATSSPSLLMGTLPSIRLIKTFVKSLLGEPMSMTLVAVSPNPLSKPPTHRPLKLARVVSSAIVDLRRRNEATVDADDDTIPANTTASAAGLMAHMEAIQTFTKSENPTTTEDELLRLYASLCYFRGVYKIGLNPAVDDNLLSLLSNLAMAILPQRAGVLLETADAASAGRIYVVIWACQFQSSVVWTIVNIGDSFGDAGTATISFNRSESPIIPSPKLLTAIKKDSMMNSAVATSPALLKLADAPTRGFTNAKTAWHTIISDPPTLDRLRNLALSVTLGSETTTAYSRTFNMLYGCLRFIAEREWWGYKFAPVLGTTTALTDAEFKLYDPRVCARMLCYAGLFSQSAIATPPDDPSLFPDQVAAESMGRSSVYWVTWNATTSQFVEPSRKVTREKAAWISRALEVGEDPDAENDTKMEVRGGAGASPYLHADTSASTDSEPVLSPSPSATKTATKTTTGPKSRIPSESPTDKGITFTLRQLVGTTPLLIRLARPENASIIDTFDLRELEAGCNLIFAQDDASGVMLRAIGVNITRSPTNSTQFTARVVLDHTSVEIP